jgi:hypothetical protein
MFEAIIHQDRTVVLSPRDPVYPVAIETVKSFQCDDNKYRLVVNKDEATLFINSEPPLNLSETNFYKEIRVDKRVGIIMPVCPKDNNYKLSLWLIAFELNEKEPEKNPNRYRLDVKNDYKFNEITLKSSSYSAALGDLAGYHYRNKVMID